MEKKLTFAYWNCDAKEEKKLTKKIDVWKEGKCNNKISTISLNTWVGYYKTLYAENRNEIRNVGIETAV